VVSPDKVEAKEKETIRLQSILTGALETIVEWLVNFFAMYSLSNACPVFLLIPKFALPVNPAFFNKLSVFPVFDF